MSTLQETWHEVFAPSRGAEPLSICVAGTSQVGKTSLLKGLAEFDSPISRWAEAGGLRFLKRADGYVLKTLDSSIAVRGKQPPPTTKAYQLASLHWLPKNGEPFVQVEINDVAGGQFQTLGDPQADAVLVADTKALLLKADVLLLMIAPEEIADIGPEAEGEEIVELRERLRNVQRSLKVLLAARIENAKNPAVFCVFTKADEYAIPWEQMRKAWPVDDAIALAEANALRPEDARVAQVFQPCVHLFMLIRQVAAGGVCQIYFSAAQPEDPAFGRTFPELTTASTSPHKYHLREGWDRRGILPLFADAFEYLYFQRGRPWRGWVTVLACALILFSLVLLHDVAAGTAAYHAEWGEFADKGGIAGLDGLKKHFDAARPGSKTSTQDYSVPFREYYLRRASAWKNPEWLFAGLFSRERLRRDFKLARGQTPPNPLTPLAWCEGPGDFKTAASY